MNINVQCLFCIASQNFRKRNFTYKFIWTKFEINHSFILCIVRGSNSRNVKNKRIEMVTLMSLPFHLLSESIFELIMIFEVKNLFGPYHSGAFHKKFDFAISKLLHSRQICSNLFWNHYICYINFYERFDNGMFDGQLEYQTQQHLYHQKM